MGRIGRFSIVWMLLAALTSACDVSVVDGAGEEPEATDGAGEAVAAVPIPRRKASGTIQARPFSYESASIENGILKLRQGKDFFADLEVMLFLFLEEKDVVPENRSWNVECDERWTSGTPHVHIAYTIPDQRIPEHESVTCGYRLQLELGTETVAGRLPGTISLRVPKLATDIAGSFEAEIEGFRVKDGVVDLTKDDLDVAHHLASLWLAKRNGGQVEVIDKGLGWLHLEKPDGRPQAGYSVYWWRPMDSGGVDDESAGDELRVTKLQFVKKDGEWSVAGKLQPSQVSQAHPISPRQDLMAFFDRTAARQFEREHWTTHGEASVFVWEVRSSYNPKAGLAETTIRYVLDPNEARELDQFIRNDERLKVVRYLFRTNADYPAYNEPASWVLDRRLTSTETVDFKSARVVRK